MSLNKKYFPRYFAILYFHEAEMYQGKEISCKQEISAFENTKFKGLTKEQGELYWIFHWAWHYINPAGKKAIQPYAADGTGIPRTPKKLQIFDGLNVNNRREGAVWSFPAEQGDEITDKNKNERQWAKSAAVFKSYRDKVAKTGLFPSDNELSPGLQAVARPAFQIAVAELKQGLVGVSKKIYQVALHHFDNTNDPNSKDLTTLMRNAQELAKKAQSKHAERTLGNKLFHQVIFEKFLFDVVDNQEYLKLLTKIKFADFTKENLTLEVPNEDAYHAIDEMILDKKDAFKEAFRLFFKLDFKNLTYTISEEYKPKVVKVPEAPKVPASIQNPADRLVAQFLRK